MTGISTHVLDTSCGRPAAGVPVVLEHAADGESFREVARGITDADGRIGNLIATAPAKGDYRIRFDTGKYFRGRGDPVFYPEVVMHVRIDSAGGKHHLPLLLSPFGYSTYRGS